MFLFVYFTRSTRCYAYREKEREEKKTFLCAFNRSASTHARAQILFDCINLSPLSSASSGRRRRCYRCPRAHAFLPRGARLFVVVFPLLSVATRWQRWQRLVARAPTAAAAAACYLLLMLCARLSPHTHTYTHRQTHTQKSPSASGLLLLLVRVRDFFLLFRFLFAHHGRHMQQYENMKAVVHAT